MQAATGTEFLETVYSASSSRSPLQRRQINHQPWRTAHRRAVDPRFGFRVRRPVKPDVEVFEGYDGAGFRLANLIRAHQERARFVKPAKLVLERFYCR